MSERAESQIGPRTEPPTDEEVANPAIIAWQFWPIKHVERDKHSGRAPDEPRVLRVFFIAPGHPVAEEDGIEGGLYFRRDYDWIKSQEEFDREWFISGKWRPIYAPGSEGSPC